MLRPNEVEFQTHLDTRYKLTLTVAIDFNISEPDQEDLTEIFDTLLSMTSLRALLGTGLGINEDVHIGSMVKGNQNLTHLLPWVGFEKIRLQDADVNIDLASLVVERKSSSLGRRHSGVSLASNIGVGASVQAMSKFDLPPSLYDFGLVNTVDSMLNAKVYLVLLLAVLFSG